MIFNEHSNLEGLHAFLGASKYHWINYDPEKLIRTYNMRQAAEKGTRLHNFAKECILLGQRLPRSNKTLNMYVNDAIGYKMKPEVILRYSDNCFGTADAISFRNKVLRIHDYKSGETPAHIEQLLIYSALFFLEYGKQIEKEGVKFDDISIELRIYQNNEIMQETISYNDILPIVNKIVYFDDIITNLREEEYYEGI